VVKAVSELALLKAAYHLGNRHVALELRTQQLRLLDDSVLADLLRMRGLLVEPLVEPFYPEPGAYEGVHSHDQQQPIHGHQHHHHR
ncbi:MAG: urease accessory protein UreE, partial [Prochlorococcus sp.]